MVVVRSAFVTPVRTPKCLSYWFSIPKTGITSIRETIAEHAGEHALTEMLPEGLKWTVVRNPYARLYSCWVDKCFNRDRYERFVLKKWIHEKCTFEEFIHMAERTPDHEADGHFRSQAWLLKRHTFYPEVILRFEQLSYRWDWFAKTIGVNPVLATKNVTRQDIGDHEAHNHAYSRDMREAVLRRYQQDFDAFGYPYWE